MQYQIAIAMEFCVLTLFASAAFSDAPPPQSWQLLLLSIWFVLETLFGRSMFRLKFGIGLCALGSIAAGICFIISLARFLGVFEAGKPVQTFILVIGSVAGGLISLVFLAGLVERKKSVSRHAVAARV